MAPVTKDLVEVNHAEWYTRGLNCREELSGFEYTEHTQDVGWYYHPILLARQRLAQGARCAPRKPPAFDTLQALSLKRVIQTYRCLISRKGEVSLLCTP